MESQFKVHKHSTSASGERFTLVVHRLRSFLGKAPESCVNLTEAELRLELGLMAQTVPFADRCIRAARLVHDGVVIEPQPRGARRGRAPIARAGLAKA